MYPSRLLYLKQEIAELPNCGIAELETIRQSPDSANSAMIETEPHSGSLAGIGQRWSAPA
jgi:hypothetical protein